MAHEALLRQWDQLERWLREYGADLSTVEKIRRAASDWHRSNRDEALLVHTAHHLKAAEALLSDERLKGRFKAVDKEYVAACRLHELHELHEVEEREDHLRRIAEQQTARAALQRRVTWVLSAAAVFVLGLLVWIVMQRREVSLQTSLVLAGAAEAAADQKLYDQSLRLGLLAARTSWRRPVAHANAAPVLARAAGASTLTLLLNHKLGVTSASFSSDGQRVVTASRDKTARVWDFGTGQPVGEPLKHGSVVNSARFSPDGQRVVTASSDNTARVWDASTGQPVGELMKHGDTVWSASFSPGGQRVVTASSDRMARVWNVFWSSLIRPETLIAQVCERKLHSNVRKLTDADVRAARILSYERVGEDVCAGVAAVSAQ